MVNKLTILECLEPFLTKPTETLHLADIARLTNTPHPTLRLWLNNLEKQGILRKTYKGRLTLYELNLDNNIIDYLTIAEKNKLIKICEKHLILKELTNFIQKNTNRNAIVFGSSADNFNKANDIDLLITGRIDKKKLKEFSKKFNKEIHLINVKNLNKISKSLKQEIIKKHLIIKGSEQILRWMLW